MIVPIEIARPNIKWLPFAIHFDTPEGTFQCTVHAICHEHAELVLRDLKDNGRIVGEILDAL
jgi:hypothetical protein